MFRQPRWSDSWFAIATGARGQGFTRHYVLAYCLMDNHVHLAIETGKAWPSRIMACLQSSYTQYFNRRHRRVGHLFQGRYKAFLIEKDRYALALLRYIHENPVKAGIVAAPQKYAWSSDRQYRRGKGREWLDVDRLLPMLGRGRSAAIRGYRKLMREELKELYENVKTWGQAVKGNEAFADRMLQGGGGTAGSSAEPDGRPRLAATQKGCRGPSQEPAGSRTGPPPAAEDLTFSSW